MCFKIVDLYHGFSTTVLLTFGAGQFFVVGGFRDIVGCLAEYQPGFYSLDSISTLSFVITQSVSRHCPLGVKINPVENHQARTSNITDTQIFTKRVKKNSMNEMFPAVHIVINSFLSNTSKGQGSYTSQ